MIIVRRPWGSDGERIPVPLYALADDQLDQTAIVASVASQGTLTLTANAANNDTVTIDGHVYTFKTTLTASTTEDEVLISVVDASGSIDNLIAAIMGTGTPGTDYGSETRIHTTISAAVGAGDTMVATSRRPGAAGNVLATTETGANMSWDAATLGTTTAGVDGDILVQVDTETTPFGVVNAPATVNGVRMLIPDEWETRGKIITYKFEDAATKAYSDEVVVIETEDHPSAALPNGVLFKGTATSVTASTLVGEASEDGIAHPGSSDASIAASLMLYIKSATVGAGQAVPVSTFTHATRTYTLLHNWPITPTGTIVYEVYSIARMPAHVMSKVSTLALSAQESTDIGALTRPPTNTALANLKIVMRDGNGDAVTGTPTGTRTIDGGAFGAVTGTITEIASGASQFDASAADMNGGSILFRFTLAGAKDSFLFIQTDSAF